MSPSKLYLLGLGVDPLEHATVEVLQAAGHCDVLYAQGLSPVQARFLSRFARGGLAVPLERESGVPRRRILADLSAGRVTGLATLGHPFYWSALAGRLVAECEKRGVPWQTFGSISPAGVAISAAGVTIGTNIYGLQSFDGAALSERRVVINPVWPLVVYFYTPLSAKAFAKAVESLLRVYPEGHPVAWCGRAGGWKETPLRDLARRRRDISPATVLYLAAREPSRSRIGRTESHQMREGHKEAPAWVKE